MSKSSGSTSSYFGNILGQLSTQLFGESNPARKDYLNMVTQPFKTGGTGVGVPLIQQSTAAARSGLAQTNSAAQAQLASLGLASDPTSRNVTNVINTEGEQQIADIGPNLAMSLITGTGANAVAGDTSAALGGLGTAGSQNTSTSGSSVDLGSLFSGSGGSGGLGSGLGSILAALFA